MDTARRVRRVRCRGYSHCEIIADEEGEERGEVKRLRTVRNGEVKRLHTLRKQTHAFRDTPKHTMASEDEEKG